jgi:undecaprenyl-diphosphatase
MDYQDALPEQTLSADQDATHEQALSVDQAPSTPPSASNRVVDGDTIKHWSRRRIATGAALWAAGVLLLVAVSFAAQDFAEFPGDVGLAVWIQQLHQPVLVHIVNFSSDANWPYPAGAIAIGVVVVLLALRRVLAAICAAFAAFGADLLNVTLNGWVARPRPNNVQIHAVAHLGLHSFPSGHVTHVIAFYGFLLYLTILAVRARPTLRYWLLPIQIICGYFIIFIGPSRVLEGEHWPSDVLGGYLLGALMLTAAITLYHVLRIAWQNYRARHKKAQTEEAPHIAA